MPTHSRKRNRSSTQGALHDQFDTLKGTVNDQIGALKATVHSIGDWVKSESIDQRDEIVNQTREHPFKAMGIALAVGMVLGMIFKKR